MSETSAHQNKMIYKSMKSNIPDLKRLFLEAYEVCGSITKACHISTIQRWQPYVWAEKDIEFKERFESVKEGFLDQAEEELIKLIRKGNLNAITFYLKNKGKERGYDADKMALSVIEPVKIHYTIPSNTIEDQKNNNNI